VDWYEQAQADLVPLLRRNSDIVIAPSNPQGYIGGLRFNHLHPPFNDVRLRRAVQTAVNQEDYMRAIMGDDRSAWRICRSQYPCGTTYGVEVELPVQKGDIETAKRMVNEAGYNGQKAVLINPTDFATIGPLGDIKSAASRRIPPQHFPPCVRRLADVHGRHFHGVQSGAYDPMAPGLEQLPGGNCGADYGATWVW
jgi:peptide/nickel transport system substrate-binding protein